MNFTIEKYTDDYHEQILQVWEKSVRATHSFLKGSDIEFYKSIVQKIDFNALTVYCYLAENKELVGFLGVAEQKLEMLFLDPQFIGKGLGKALITFAIKELGVTEVDVNEDNINAHKFYLKFGFKVFNRNPTDDSGRPYPILQMKL